MDEAGASIISTTPSVSKPTKPGDDDRRGTRVGSSQFGRNTSSRRARSQREDQSWQPPILTGGFRPGIGSSIVEEFVAGHDAGDVLRELVQNEFDAGGTQVSVTFGLSDITVSGNGRPPDRKGWERLGVIFGTGRVVGGSDDRSIEPKENGIGSKNFGLRSLFIFGDRIHVRSNGRVAVLDLREMGTQQLRDADSRGRRGVSVHVPYRSEQFQSLEPFTIEREQRTLDQIERGLLATLVKLARPGARPGVRRLTLVSNRTGREFDWLQTAETMKCKAEGILAIQRIGRLRSVDRGSIKRVRLQTFEEIEFFRPIAIPAEHAKITFPAYYHAPGGAVRVCVSIPLRRGRVDRARPGHFYYPLQTPQGCTGVAVSVSAPFKLDADRTSLLDSTWNEWLAEQAAQLTQDLLSEDWLRRYGADGYLALDGLWPASPGSFAAKISAHLREATCWPTQDFTSANTLAKASKIVIPDDPAFEGFLSHNRYLDRRLAESREAIDLTLRNEARRFTLNSFVRLRCAGASFGPAAPPCPIVP
jgi:hypothetical protein